MPKPTPETIRDNITDTYFNLRVAMAGLSFLFPIVFYAYTRKIYGELQQDSMSAFYGAYDGFIRDWFVGVLCAVGSFLVSYKGLSTSENWLLNGAGASAIGIAMFPCNCWVRHVGDTSTVHGTFAFAFFACMSIVVLWFSRKTLCLVTDHRWNKFFHFAYTAIGFFLIASIVTVFALRRWVPSYKAAIFRIEWLGIWAFAAYWGLKTFEYWKTAAVRRAARGELTYDHEQRLVPVGSPEGVP
jgi:hypothetical protein